MFGMYAGSSRQKQRQIMRVDSCTDSFVVGQFVNSTCAAHTLAVIPHNCSLGIQAERWSKPWIIFDIISYYLLLPMINLLHIRVLLINHINYFRFSLEDANKKCSCAGYAYFVLMHMRNLKTFFIFHSVKACKLAILAICVCEWSGITVAFRQLNAAFILNMAIL